MQGKYQHPVQSTHLPSPPKTWSTNYLGPGVEQSQAFTKSKLLTCTSSALQVNILKMWPIHSHSESTPACFWPQYLQLHRSNPPASAIFRL